LAAIRLTQILPGFREDRVSHESPDRFLAALLNGSPNPILVLDANAVILYVNSEFETQTGFDFDEVVGLRPPYPWWTEDTEARFYRLMAKNKRATPARRISDDRHLFRKKDGSQFWVELITSRVNDGDRSFYFMTTWMDIGRRIDEAETARTLINHTAEPALLLDPDHRIIAINRAGAKWLDATTDELVNRDYFGVIPAALRGLWLKQIDRALKTQHQVNFNSESGGVYYANSITPVFNTRREVFRLALFARDITLRRHTEVKIRSAFKELISAVRVSVPNLEQGPTSVLTAREGSVV